MDEITAEFATEDIASPPVLRVRPRLRVAARTDVGRHRENNEDKYEIFESDTDSDLAAKGSVFVVCDGMGGHNAGQVASELAAKTFVDVYLSHPSESLEDSMGAAAKAANRVVLDASLAISSRQGMGTTLTALVIRQDEACCVHVGDSRLYRLRDDEVEQLTVDQTWMEQVIREGVMTRELAEGHPYRNMLLQAVGTDPDLKPLTLTFAPRAGDRYLLCSDGLTGHVSDAQIGQALAMPSLGRASWRLVSEALADGGSDNCTVLLVAVDDLSAAESPE
ncbi:MAG: protein phosphatase 2C domain-containing protein [Fimbriimonadaceae bacterium]|nr:protein phosphatase 2C domain-containing protein [Fimbriimonadaceae bacterium]